MTKQGASPGADRKGFLSEIGDGVDGEYSSCCLHRRLFFATTLGQFGDC